MKKPELSIVIVSFNTAELLQKCLSSLNAVRDEVSFEVIVVDNASEDGSVDMVRKMFPNVKLILSKKNLGFAGGNNLVRKYVKGDNVLFLNSDTTVPRGTLKNSLEKLHSDKYIGALTCKIVLPNGEMDKDTRRSFITPWNGLVHLFLKLDRVFPKSKLFASYWYGYIPENATHEVDVIQGAFFLTYKKVLDETGWFDEDYFLDGEDIDLCWKIKESGRKIIYYPEAKIIHFKGASKGKATNVRKKDIPLKNRLKYRLAGVNSMEIFYRKRLWNKYPLILNYCVLMGIRVIKSIRLLRTLFLG